LIENKVDLECEDMDKCRPIHYACDNNNLELVKLLIENKVNLE